MRVAWCSDHVATWSHEVVLCARLIVSASHIVLREAELPFEPIKIDEHTKAISGGGDFRSVNPLGYVPALVLDDETLLTELSNTLPISFRRRSLRLRMARSKGSNCRARLNFFASEMHKDGFSPHLAHACRPI